MQFTRASELLGSRLFVRFMGGGPRTFPGGLNKWQWKRLHEKKAREKEKRLLDQEKQLYQARIRSQIRSKLADGGIDSSSAADAGANYNPMTPKDHVKALADRFMKEGAEDLWNEDDGPLKSTPSRSSERSEALNREQGSRDSATDSSKLMTEA
ncbi:Putative DEAD-box ATP-dependent RNA helicase 33 [Linum perenne]